MVLLRKQPKYKHVGREALVSGNDLHVDLGGGLQRRTLQEAARTDPGQKNLQGTRGQLGLVKSKAVIRRPELVRSYWQGKLRLRIEIFHTYQTPP